ncbi:UvrD-helicase domain-containing protein [Thiotrichales bacterium 19S9-12]|nr:UvrD-helicase domain-containing protein [Thiotrichales bacterium 19S9-11]MCF6810908.1 UvrD-helicase domain-containing protein [Thiotrichales bacterium 19S9-12]
MQIADYNQRSEALDTNKSFIVEAPAGSGKTELLTQRFLALLSKVKRPESIVAITFTKKAAFEMKKRITDALLLAKLNTPFQSPHQKITLDLAKNALKQDQTFNWQLLDNPNLLDVTTIDAFCLKLTKAMPEASSFLTSAKISDNIDFIYQKALDSLLNDLSEKHPLYPSLSHILNHLDNNLDVFYDLIIRMLKTREQWLSLLINDHHLLREKLEGSFIDIINLNLEQLADNLSPYLSELESLTYYAAKNLGLNYQNHKLDDKLENLVFWQFFIKNLLLTKDHKIKKRLTKKEGFITDSKDKEKKAYQKKQKDALSNLLDEIKSLDQIDLIINLCTNLKSMTYHYDKDEWLILNDIIKILIYSTQSLLLTFRQFNQVDFNQVAINALSALGDEDTPSDLMLYLDYQFEHLLIDEFQDTSQLQYRLLEKLTSGWLPSDGRTLFLVGDPMQSIYRFRQAEVELFLTASEGIGEIKPKKLNLSCNFRSDLKLINWINQTFCNIFPKADDKTLGAISYRKSSGILNFKEQQHSLYATYDNYHEAIAIVDTIKKHRSKDKNCQIGILARSRNHLDEIILQLKTHKINYNETEIETLYHQKVITDLTALLEVLIYPYEKLSWVKLLTSRIFSLNLDAIETLFDLFDLSDYKSFNCFLLEQLKNLTSKESNEIIAPIKDQLHQLQEAFSLRYQQTLTHILKSLWLNLKAQDYYDQFAHDNTNIFFEELRTFESQGHLDNITLFYQKLQLIRSSKNQQANIHLMTIHKSKGLEFDVVIIPGLNKTPRHLSSELLNYDYFHNQNNEQCILLSAKAHSWDDTPSAFYQLLQETKKRRLHYEAQRLLYVGITRAKAYLYCFSQFDLDAPKVNKRSLFSYLYPLSQTQWINYPIDNTTTKKEHSDNHSFQPTQLITNNHPSLIALKDKKRINNPHPEFDYFQLESQLLGNTVHQVLEKLIKRKVQKKTDNQTTQDYLIKQQLILNGASNEQKIKLIPIINQAIDNTLSEKSISHYLNHAKDVFCEYSLYYLDTKEKAKLRQSIIDLVIIDYNQNAIIIDYKTASPSNSTDLTTFLKDETKTYQAQLKQYQFLIKHHFKPKSVCAFLYFPLINKLVTI